MSNSTGRESDKFMLRMPDGMRDRIRLAAEKNNRSMNAEIVATLESAYPPPVRTVAVAIAVSIHALQSVIDTEGVEVAKARAAEMTAELREVGYTGLRLDVMTILEGQEEKHVAVYKIEDMDTLLRAFEEEILRNSPTDTPNTNFDSPLLLRRWIST